MSGHSHWANHPPKEGRSDAKKGAIFTRPGAGNCHGGPVKAAAIPDSNFRLALAIEKSTWRKYAKGNIDRAIKTRYPAMTKMALSMKRSPTKAMDRMV